MADPDALRMLGFDDMKNNYVLVDAGASLTNKKFTRDLSSVVRRAQDSGVQKIIVSSSNSKNSQESLRLSRLYPGVLYATAGIHPHDAASWNEVSLQELRATALAPECVAIGECGLDYSKCTASPDDQKHVFKQQVELACALKKPLLVIEREAQDDLLGIINEFKSSLPPVVIHSFGSASPTGILKYLGMGFYIGITGYICKDSSDCGIQELLKTKRIPLEQMVIQSGSPFMYPNARSSKLSNEIKSAFTERSLAFLNRYCTFQRNEPCSLPALIELIAALLERTPEDISLSTAFNSLKIFDIS